MADSTTGQVDYIPQPIEIELDEFRLIEGTCKPVLFAGFVTILLACTAISIATGPFSTIFDSVLAGIKCSFCASIGLGIPLFFGWGISVFLGFRLNSILGNPLNPSAVAALAAGVGFGLAHTVASAGVASDFNLNSGSLATFAIVAVLGSMLFQTVARVRVKREIARHNARAARKLYMEPPCDVRFQISQVMTLMVVVSLFLALAMHLADEKLVLLVALWGFLTAATFYPAILISQWVDRKLGSVVLKPWEELRPTEWKLASEMVVTPLAQLVDQPQLATSGRVVEAPLDDKDNILDPMPNYRIAVRFTSFDAMSSAIRWVGFAGGAFGLLFVVFLETSKAVSQEQVAWTGIVMALPAVLGGLILGSALSAFIMLFLGMINFLTGDRIRMGTLAALAGGLAGSVGAWILLCGFEIVHFVPWSGAVDFSTANNHFPLAMTLIASSMGQIYGRLGVKNCGSQSGLTYEDYQSESTGPALSRFTLIVLILSACAWMMVFVHSQSSATHATEDHFGTMVVGAFACTLLVWPLANFLARSVRVATENSSTPRFSLGALRQPQA